MLSVELEHWRVDFDSRYPIFKQIVVCFSRAIVRGELKAGDRIPSIRDLSAALKINVNTIQRAYREMERDGLIYSQRGMGYFIMENENITETVKKTMTESVINRFLTEMRELGLGDADILSALTELIKRGDNNDSAEN